MATTSLSISIASASASGVCTLPRFTGRSAVASYSSIVMTLRARARNSSGCVALSRSPRRLSATSGCLLTLSATDVTRDEPTQRVDGDLQHAVHVGRVEVMYLPGPELVHPEGARSRAQLAQARHDEERRRLHVVAQHPGPGPHLELVAQVRAGHLVGQQVGVEGVDRRKDADVVRRTRRLGPPYQRRDNP